MKKLSLRDQKTLERASVIREKMAQYESIEFTDPEHVKVFLLDTMSQLQNEQFKVLFLDAQHQLIEQKTMFMGTINHATIYPREIIKEALKLNASAMIFAHNHPGGDPEPSQADKTITDKLINAAKLLDIKVLDHIIVGGNQMVSMSEKGLI